MICKKSCTGQDFALIQRRRRIAGSRTRRAGEPNAAGRAAGANRRVDRGVAHGASPSAHPQANPDGQGLRTHPPHRAAPLRDGAGGGSRARLARAARGGDPEMARPQRGPRLRARDETRRAALAAAPSHARRRHRRPAHLGRDEAALRASRRARERPGRGACANCSVRSASPPTASSGPRRSGPCGASSAAAGWPPTASSAPPRGPRWAIPAPPWCSKRRGGSRGSLEGPADRRRGDRASRNALQVRRRPRALERLGLRLLRLGLLRAARRRAAPAAAHLGRLHALGRARTRAPRDHLRPSGARVHGHQRASLRHDGPG